MPDSNNELQSILDSIICGVLLIDRDTKKIKMLNQTAADIISLPKDKIFERYCCHFICGNSGLCPDQPVILADSLLRISNGSQIPIIRKAVPIEIDGKPFIVESFVDMSRSKQAEERLKYYGLHDPLTGLYNRARFEEEMQSVSSGGFSSAGIIICDVDNLKIINDTWGHQAGDEILVAAAKVLKASFRQGDVIARIGGDEFAILLPNATMSVVDSACRRIQNRVIEYNASDPRITLGLSIGCAARELSKASISQIFKEADDRLYQEKEKKRSKGVRVEISPKLTEMLEIKEDAATGVHERRAQELMVKFGKMLDLPRQRIVQLRLLAQFHDIGKVGVPDQILFKPGKLTPEETAIMRKHSEIGHRIAKSANELIQISEWILKHHEWWNGEGYPLGLKGKDIPLECRMLAIVDAFDAMTSDRPYRKAMSVEQALEELKRCAGEQFDPFLVNKFIELIQKEEKIKNN